MFSLMRKQNGIGNNVKLKITPLLSYLTIRKFVLIVLYFQSVLV
jgi:hypothetical protein